MECWHDQFNPEKFLSKINIDKLIERNEAYNENKVDKLAKPCIFCQGLKSPGLLLNDKSYLCKICFEEISKIKYPEYYENLRREYILKLEARRQARDAFLNSCPFKKLLNLNKIAIFVLLITSLFKPTSLLLIIGLFLINYILKARQEKRISQWDSLYPAPPEPKMRHFHDPLAKLSSRDFLILKIFNNWPGYPPFWQYLRQIVMERDGNRCQVSGCPSRVELHIHHKIPVSKGGQHIPENLITLCCFHHALEPDEGHERIWAEVKTKYFTIVRAHIRKNPYNYGFHNVRAHVRRLELSNQSDISKIINFYGLICPNCNNLNFNIDVIKQKQKIIITCINCFSKWIGPRKLAEENGPRLAEVLTVTKNRGNWNPRWEMLEERTESTFNLMKTLEHKNSKKRKTILSKKASAPKCPKCGATMRLVRPKPGQKWKAFWGCSMYNKTGCNETINIS
ncbi:MAG: HNH endonuclease signature motif containing protein [Desulfobaccales bacterium]